MTYTTGSVIDDADYNGFAADTDAVWGVGSTDSGYGQSNTVGTVAAGATVTATQWATLLTRIASAAAHQGTTISAIANPTVGVTISAYAALSTNITAITNGRRNAATVGSSVTGNTDRTTAWTTSTTFTQTVAFPSANQARYFFNSGGRITLSCSRSGGSVTSSNTALTGLCTDYGTLNFTTGTATQTIAGGSYTGTTKTGGAGSPTIVTGTGFYNLTGTLAQVCTQSASSYYGYVGLSITTSLSYTGSTVTVRNVVANSGGLDATDGTLRFTIGTVAPESANIANTWGAITLGGSNA